MISGIGCDIVDIPRVKKACENPGFMRRAFSEEENEYFDTLKHPISTIAGAWAAKEAFSKALGTGVHGFSLTEISLKHTELGAPYLSLTGNALKAAKGMKIHISISHAGDYAAAYCILEGKD